MATVKIRPYAYDPSKWEIDIHYEDINGDRRRFKKKSPHNTKKQSEAYANKLLARLLNEKPKSSEPEEPTQIITLTEYAEEYLKYIPANGHKCKPSMLRTKRLHLNNHLIPAFGDKPLDQITNDDWMQLRNNMLKDEYKTKSINNVLSVLSHLLKTAVEQGIISDLPCRVVQQKLPYEEYQEMAYLSYEELDKMIDISKPDPICHLAILLGSKCGLRMGEILGLCWDYIHWDQKKLHIAWAYVRPDWTSPKGKRDRWVPLLPQVLEALRAVRELNRDPELVMAQSAGKLYFDDQLRTMVKRVMIDAGIENLDRPVHRLRHTFCSHLAMRGANIKAIAQLAGHANIQTTLQYMHLSPDAEYATIALLE